MAALGRATLGIVIPITARQLYHSLVGDCGVRRFVGLILPVGLIFVCTASPTFNRQAARAVRGAAP
jgi:hypothetical protein